MISHRDAIILLLEAEAERLRVCTRAVDTQLIASKSQELVFVPSLPLCLLTLIPHFHLLLDPRVLAPREFDFLHAVHVTLSSFASATRLPDW